MRSPRLTRLRLPPETDPDRPGERRPASPSAQRYVARYRERLASGAEQRSSEVSWVRLAALTAAFTPMTAVAALPVTAALGFGTSVIANATSPRTGLIVMITVVAAMGVATARFAVANPGASGDRGWRRWLPLVATVAVAAAGLTEVLSGSKAPDPVLALWFLTVGWMIVFVPRATRPWSAAQRTLWAIGPTVTAATIVVVWTAGFFSYRFDRALDEFDAYAEAQIAGTPFRAGVDIDGFTVKNRGFLRGCEQAFRIEGWHELDSRWIAYCPAGRPAGDEIDHLAGRWYEFPAR